MVDVVGVGLNATDTLIRLPHLPALDTKVEIRSLQVCPGGQVASAIVACRRWGLRTRYIGKVGEDAEAALQRREMTRERVEARFAVARGCGSQVAYILVDERAGERTILWKRDPRLELRPEELRREWVVRARALLVDGHDVAAAATAARWADAAGIPVIADVDNVYPGVERLLRQVDYLIGSREFPARIVGERNLLKALPQLRRRFHCKFVGATLGRDGVVGWDGQRFYYSPAFLVKAMDTTGAGDVFHGAFVYALLRDWPIERILDFSCAAAGLNCTATGARGGIKPLEEILKLCESGKRHARLFSSRVLERAAKLK
jgi:sugar/nucleoside kinase (ribokinase family)